MPSQLLWPVVRNAPGRSFCWWVVVLQRVRETADRVWSLAAGGYRQRRADSFHSWCAGWPAPVCTVDPKSRAREIYHAAVCINAVIQLPHLNLLDVLDV